MANYVSQIIIPINGTPTTLSTTKQETVSSTAKSYITAVSTVSSTAQNMTAIANASVYEENGKLNAEKLQVAEKVIQQYNSTTESLDFIFN